MEKILSAKKEQIIANVNGTRDFASIDVDIRQKIISILKSIFENADAIELDTPVIERRSIVDQMYGDEFNKLVYQLVNPTETSSKLMLRYDLTVPLARYCAINSTKVLRRYQIGKVYRRDKANITAGRYREFYQCDFDIVGDDGGSAINDVEILDLLVRILDKLLGRRTYKIKISNRKLLTDILRSIGIDPSLVLSICSTIDKLDKFSFDELIAEFETKGMTHQQVIILKQLFELPINDINILDQLTNYTDEQTIESIKKMFAILKYLEIDDAFEFDLSLARGMDYYTGIIYEAVYLDKSIMSSSIAAGGRYDKMIGKLSNHCDIPAIGLSIGLERIVKIIEETSKNFCQKKNPSVYVASIGASDKVINERIKLCSELRNKGLTVAMSNKANPKMAAQFDTVFNQVIKFMIIIGEREISAGQIKIKEISTRKESIYNRSEGIDFLVANC
jgi:histidyl-tRNA synthetase